MEESFLNQSDDFVNLSSSRILLGVDYVRILCSERCITLLIQELILRHMYRRVDLAVVFLVGVSRMIVFSAFLILVGKSPN